MAELGIVYGAADFRLTPEGEYVFLEINPAGEFLFVEQGAGHPITTPWPVGSPSRSDQCCRWVTLLTDAGDGHLEGVGIGTDRAALHRDQVSDGGARLPARRDSYPHHHVPPSGERLIGDGEEGGGEQVGGGGCCVVGRDGGGTSGLRDRGLGRGEHDGGGVLEADVADLEDHGGAGRWARRGAGLANLNTHFHPPTVHLCTSARPRPGVAHPHTPSPFRLTWGWASLVVAEHLRSES
jgi:hypothetical protein